MSINLTNRIVNGNNKPLTGTLANHLFYYPTPSHLNYNWSFGSLVGLFFALQIVTGIFLAMHYTPHIEWAFASVEHIMTDVNGGYLFRYFHANGASAVFILMYLHIARNLYYQSYLTRRALWHTGLVIFLLMMATAFIGYVLPWGQMSFWGATVITSLVTAVPFVGEDIAYWVWGGFSINNATLTRFFSLHYLLPFVITGLIGVHLVLLHTDGSSDPLTLPVSPDRLTFHPYFSYKDAFIFLVTFAAFGALVCYFPNLLGHSDNFLPANPLVTPAHIVPEWYFTPFYAILRACPNKLGGAIGMFAAIILLFFIPFYVDSRTAIKLVFAPYSTPHKVAFWLFTGVFFTLMFLGSRAAAAPYVGASKLFTGLYFAYFLIVLPALAWLGEAITQDVNAEETEAYPNECPTIRKPKAKGEEEENTSFTTRTPTDRELRLARKRPVAPNVDMTYPNPYPQGRAHEFPAKWRGTVPQIFWEPPTKHERPNLSPDEVLTHDGHKMRVPAGVVLEEPLVEHAGPLAYDEVLTYSGRRMVVPAGVFLQVPPRKKPRK